MQLYDGRRICSWPSSSAACRWPCCGHGVPAATLLLEDRRLPVEGPMAEARQPWCRCPQRGRPEGRESPPPTIAPAARSPRRSAGQRATDHPSAAPWRSPATVHRGGPRVSSSNPPGSGSPGLGLFDAGERHLSAGARPTSPEEPQLPGSECPQRSQTTLQPEPPSPGPRRSPRPRRAPCPARPAGRLSFRRDPRITQTAPDTAGAPSLRLRFMTKALEHPPRCAMRTFTSPGTFAFTTTTGGSGCGHQDFPPQQVGVAHHAAGTVAANRR